MARPRAITDEALLDAARAVFIRSGPGATTAEIAEAAGVSEATLFRRYATKDALFMAAMELPPEPGWAALANALAEDPRPLRERLEVLATALLDFFREIIPRVMVLRAAGIDLSCHMTQLAEPPPVKGLKAVAHFFHREQRAGRVRPVDPEIPARLLIGAMHHHAFFEACGLDAHAPLPPASYVRGAVDVILRGVEVETAK
ncbi:MAG: TetR/AcrR family transcriptional regulator [Deltaproteobacteria bacterium]|nr:MAG: TetR/AcrR family transcriptional regulator [Deltaproteobacteria bacterium]